MNAAYYCQISAFTATDDLSQVAIGFANGAVTLIRGDLIYDLGSKQRIVFESEEPVTGVQLATDEKLTTLFVSTTSRIIKLGLSKKGQGLPPKTVEDSGCDLGCMALDKRTGDVVVAREDAIYTYTLDGRGPPRAYESPKSMVATYQNYVVLSCPPSNSGSGDTETMRRRYGGGAEDALFNASTLVLLEPDLRIIGHTETLISPVRFIFEVWGDLYTVTREGKVCFDQSVCSTSVRATFANQYHRFIDTTKRACNSVWKCSTRETCFRLLLSWPRILA